MLVLVGIGSVLVSYMTKSSENSVKKYTTYTVKTIDPIILDGSVSSTAESSITLDATKGTIKEVHVSEGQEVLQGDALFTYSNSLILEELEDLKRQQARLYTQRAGLYEDIESQKQKKAAFVAAAKSAVSSESTSSASAAASSVDTSVYDSTIDSLQKSIRELNASIEDLAIRISRDESKKSETIYAPVSGRVSIDELGKTSPAVAFIKISGAGGLISSTVSEYDYEAIKEGEKVSIYVNAQDRYIDGVIASVAKEPTASKLSVNTTSSVSRYAVSVTPSQELTIGFNVQIHVPQTDLVVPEAAVVVESGKEYVYIFSNGTAHKTLITRAKKGLITVVTQGLQIGDVLISNPDDTLTDQAAVEVLSEGTK